MKFEPVLEVAGPKDAVEPVLMLPLVPVRKETGTKGKIVVHPMARFLLVHFNQAILLLYKSFRVPIF